MTMMVDGTNVRGMTQDQLAVLGVSDIAYVKPVLSDSQLVYAIHSADGRPVGVAESREVAFAAVRQNNLEPMSVH